MTGIAPNPRDRFRTNLDHLDTEGQLDAVLAEVRATGGRFDPPGTAGGVWWELELHGITAQGVSAETAVAHWKGLAGRLPPDAPKAQFQFWWAIVTPNGEDGRLVEIAIPSDTALADLERAARVALVDTPLPVTTPILALHRPLVIEPNPPAAALRVGDPRLCFGETDVRAQSGTPPELRTHAHEEHG